MVVSQTIERMVNICIKTNEAIYLYEDIGNEEEFGVLMLNEDIFDNPRLEQYVRIKDYCTNYLKELKRYYNPLFQSISENQSLNIDYNLVSKYFDVRPFLIYQYQADMYSFDDYIDFEQYGIDLLKKYRWYQFDGNNLLVEE